MVDGPTEPKGHTMSTSDDKYVTFRREDFIELLNYQGLSHLTRNVLADAEKVEIKDAVVIRRQDKFASPALATYAAMIAIAMSMTADEEMKSQLSRISDYFEDQARLAADEGWKLPDV